MSRWLRVVGAVAALFVLAASWDQACTRTLRRPSTAAVDILPLWLGAAVVAAGGDPTDPRALEAQFDAERLRMRPGGFYSYYPPTASLFALPLRALPYREAVWWWRLAAALATPVGVVLAVAGGFRGGRLVPLGVGALVAALLVCARPARVVLVTGQVGPWIVLASGLAMFLLSRGRARGAGAIIAFGAAIKVVPAVLLLVLAARREGKALAVAAVMFAVATAALLWFGVPLHPVAWARGLVEFVGRRGFPGSPMEPAWLHVLQSSRLAAPAVSLGLFAWCARRGLDDEDAANVAALLIAGVGVVMAGSFLHEALIVLPAMAHALAWGAQARSRWAMGASAALLVACALDPGGFVREGRPDRLDWVGLAWAAWAVCALRAIRDHSSLPSRFRAASAAGPGGATERNSSK